MDHFTPRYQMRPFDRKLVESTGHAGNVGSHETREVRTRGRWFLAGGKYNQKIKDVAVTEPDWSSLDRHITHGK